MINRIPMDLRSIFILFFIWSLIFILPKDANGQSLQDISSIKVDDLTDQQLQQLVKRAEESGLSESELLQMAQVRGVPQEEIDKLRERLESLALTTPLSSGSSMGPSKRKPRQQADLNSITQGVLNPQQAMQSDREDSPYFGLNLFYSKDRRLTFEPNLNMATPKNYILGPGDLVYIDIYGQSEKYYEAYVTAEGNLLLENIGPINVSGLSVEELTNVLKSRLSRFYSGISGANPNTFLQVSLGNLRTIKVHLVGEVRLPGTFSLSAFSTVFNAMYAGGGPNENGTMRNVKLIRNNQEIAVIDVYDFLLNGKANLNLQLQDQDVLLVPPFLGRVTLNGEVKRPAIFEIKEGESFRDLLDYAGGFTDEAFRDRVSVTRITSRERAVSDVFNDQFGMFLVKGGDTYEIGKVLNRYTNRIQIKGAVFREGNYSMEEGITLQRLITKAEGLKGDAYLKRASILRTKEDLSNELIQVNLGEIINGNLPDILLQAEDIVRIASIYDLNEDFYVKIAGEVRNPGTYPYSQDMTAEDLIILAGGLKESASLTEIEIARRYMGSNARDYADIIPVSISPDLGLGLSVTPLKPFDNISVRRKPNFTLEKMVQVEGQVNAPGEFSIAHAEERVSDVIRRAGGLTDFAYVKGATLIRRTEFYQAESEMQRKEMNLRDLLENLNIDQMDPTESQTLLLQRLARSISNKASSKETEAGEMVIDARSEILKEISENRLGIGPVKIRETEAIAIDLEAVLLNPGSRFDLILEEGDIITIPRQLQTVRLRGDVIYPTTVRYEELRGMKYYINRAGGFENRAKRKRTYVIYANGEVARTKHFLVFNVFPSVEPGAEVIVPSKGPRIPIRPGDLLGITTGLATMALIATQIFNQ
ncbi:SLBB domain-containing protein [Lunatibacter salilacus]|uniref:SLBB domain-containing protein n=1 Tax=Lunatibacter salilacus TaxID=2483804 RepID=UPI001F42EB51|nr:SLBB domain-containing protein [Lunatibacter salilacus]